MSYTIKIIKTEKQTVKKQAYQVIGKEDGDEKYGYAPYEAEENVSNTIYEQTVDSLKVDEVIKAVLASQ